MQTVTLEDLKRMYCEENLSVHKIGDIVGHNGKWVWRRLRPLGVLRRPGKMNSNGTNLYGTGRIHLKHGYIALRSPNHPYCTCTGYVTEHRLVMEQHLGRYLDPKEVVHHIDGDVTNNELSNLQLFSSNSEHISVTTKGKVPASRIAAAVAAAKIANTGRKRPAHWKYCGKPLPWCDDQIRKWYVDDDLTLPQLAGLLGRTDGSVRHRLHAIGVPLREGKYRKKVAVTQHHLREAAQLEPKYLGRSIWRERLYNELPLHLKTLCEELGLYPCKKAHQTDEVPSIQSADSATIDTMAFESAK